jgi:hypothetical protein
VAPPNDPSQLYRSGHIIPPEFAGRYLQMGDEAVLGPPLTEARYNPELRRTEQFFAGIGFFRRDGDPPDAIQMMAYGAAACPTCRRVPVPIDAIIELPGVANTPTLRPAPQTYHMFIPQITRDYFDAAEFLDALTGLSSNFTGPPLTDPFIAPDGAIEIIFKNVAVFADRATPRQLQLRDVSRQIGVVPGELQPPTPSSGFGFYEIEDGLGYNIPIYFLHYLDLHGGLAVAGEPLTALNQVEPQVWRQCFANLCLEEDRGGAEGIWMRLAALGKTYQQIARHTQPVLALTASGRVIAIYSWPQHDSLAATESQVINAQISENSLPAIGIQPLLLLTLPDGSRQTYVMPPTDADGQTRYTLPPIPAPNATVIGYQVCLLAPSGEQYCFRSKWATFASP